ncbi:hypothetical protein APR04_004871 [Promicromonospora umidemergens]|uniref:Integral membrane protein n=2 Tax=Promicromonospora umidemergens TaxID=629679 RepID=A0ABP8WE74_9MICO|nr:hypothetical protein [Promicromonospora umidemergens]
MDTRDDHATRARVLRGGLAGVSATLVALASHLAAGGQLPGPLGIVVPLALSLPVCMAWAGRQLSLPRLSASVVASQLFFHVLFMLGTPTNAVAPPAGRQAHAGHEAMHLATTPVVQEAGHASGLAHAGATMWIWHAVAAVVTITVLYRGELMLLRLRELAERMAAWLLRGWAVLEGARPFVAPRLPRVLAETFRPLHPSTRLTPVSRRGPPAPHAV